MVKYETVYIVNNSTCWVHHKRLLTRLSNWSRQVPIELSRVYVQLVELLKDVMTQWKTVFIW